MSIRVSTWRVAAAFAAVYSIWGGSYLAIRFALETVPPFFLAGTRFVVAGLILYGWARWRGAPRPRLAHWGGAAIIGGLLLFGGNGGVTWAEQTVPSGIAALLIATVPLWMVLLDWLRPGGRRPGGRVLLGVAIGLAGIVLLIGPGKLAGGGRVDPLGAIVLLLAALSWGTGSLLSRRVQLPAAPLLATAMEMLAGGGLLLAAGLLSGEWRVVWLDAWTLRSSLAMLYLVILASLVAFSAYVWLLRVSTPAKVSTYAYVNPVIAVLLGWLLAGEPLTLRVLLAAAVITAAVIMITTYRGQAPVKTERKITSLVAKPSDA
ncbi:MAG: EamA family transporter [Chloroflexota bacterium]